ncbi:hypothetical protein ACWGI9_20725 [Streptomyces sp. NPDC054833]
MSTLLQELSKKAAERWATVLLGPGLIFVVCGLVAHHQGFSHPLDLDALRSYVKDIGTDKANREPANLLVSVGLFLLGVALAGLLAASAGRFVERCLFPEHPSRYATVLTRWRAWRWDSADTSLTRAVTQASRTVARDRLLRVTTTRTFPEVVRRQVRRDRIAATRPTHPTWPAQRMAEVTDRVRRRYGLELAEVWPHIWSVAGGESRADIQTVRDNTAAAARLMAWGWGYAALAFGTGWYPAAVPAAVLMPVSLRRARDAADVLATLVEGAVDLHLREVAERLGVPCPDAFGPGTAAAVNAIPRA